MTTAPDATTPVEVFPTTPSRGISTALTLSYRPSHSLLRTSLVRSATRHAAGHSGAPQRSTACHRYTPASIDHCLCTNCSRYIAAAAAIGAVDSSPHHARYCSSARLGHRTIRSVDRTPHYQWPHTARQMAAVSPDVAASKASAPVRPVMDGEMEHLDGALTLRLFSPDGGFGTKINHLRRLSYFPDRLVAMGRPAITAAMTCSLP